MGKDGRRQYLLALCVASRITVSVMFLGTGGDSTAKPHTEAKTAIESFWQPCRYTPSTGLVHTMKEMGVEKREGAKWRVFRFLGASWVHY